MKPTSRKSTRKKSKAIPLSTGSPALEAGRSLFDSPDGPQLDLFGAPVVLASRSRPTGGIKASKIVATCGRFSYGSSQSVALQQSLASNLRELLPSVGSTGYAMTWKRLVTPSGRRFCRLAVLGRLTKDPACSGWPTPNTEGWRSDGELRLLAQIAANTQEFLILSHRACRSKQLRWWAKDLTKNTKRTGRVDPNVYRWLMGFPMAWESAAELAATAMR